MYRYNLNKVSNQARTGGPCCVCTVLYRVAGGAAAIVAICSHSLECFAEQARHNLLQQICTWKSPRCDGRQALWSLRESCQITKKPAFSCVGISEDGTGFPRTAGTTKTNHSQKENIFNQEILKDARICQVGRELTPCHQHLAAFSSLFF